MKTKAYMLPVLAAAVLLLNPITPVSAQPNILTNGDFEADPVGTVGGGTDVIDTTSITGWRTFAVGGATGTATVSAAAGRSGLGIELVRSDPLGADSAMDKDDSTLREPIPAEQRIYKLTVDARDGGEFGGTPQVALGAQFTDTTANRTVGFDPGADFETIGLTARSDAGGTLSARLDLNGNTNASVQLDNAVAVDVTFGANRLVNGGFENSASRLLNWRSFDTTGVSGSASLSSDANSGDSAALLDITTSPPSGDDAGLDLFPNSVGVVGGETLTFSFAAKNVRADLPETSLKATIASFDAAGSWLGDLDYFVTPGSSDYESFSFDVTLPADAASVNIGYRVWDDLLNSHSAGAYLIDDVSLLRPIVPVEGDFNSDGSVDGSDFLGWQRGESPNSLSPDDLTNWQSAYGTLPSSTATVEAVPEPGGLTLLGLASLAGSGLSRIRRTASTASKERNELPLEVQQSRDSCD